MLKKLTTVILSSLLVVLLCMPLVSAWASYASATLKFGQASVTSGEVGLSTQALYSGDNTTTSDQGGSVDFLCHAAYYTSVYTLEQKFTIEKNGNRKSVIEKQKMLSKYKIIIRSCGYCKETASGSVKLQ